MGPGITLRVTASAVKRSLIAATRGKSPGADQRPSFPSMPAESLADEASISIYVWHSDLALVKMKCATLEILTGLPQWAVQQLESCQGDFYLPRIITRIDCLPAPRHHS